MLSATDGNVYHTWPNGTSLLLSTELLPPGSLTPSYVWVSLLLQFDITPFFYVTSALSLGLRQLFGCTAFNLPCTLRLDASFLTSEERIVLARKCVVPVSQTTRYDMGEG